MKNDSMILELKYEELVSNINKTKFKWEIKKKTLKLNKTFIVLNKWVTLYMKKERNLSIS